MTRAAHRTGSGAYYVGKAEDLIREDLAAALRGKVQLVLTSPPFPLNKKKSYGNLTGAAYKAWLAGFAEPLANLLKPDGSIVMELGNAWVKGRPVQSLLHLESLIAFVKARGGDLRLCQQFVCYNPARLPSPAQWVTIERIRLTDSFTHVWWMAKSDYPKADNRKVVRPYSNSMKALLKRQTYNDGLRPSQHQISKNGFLRRHRGSIQPNLIQLETVPGAEALRLPSVMRVANTASNDFFFRTCRDREITPHPARMALELASFFIEFLTDPGDLVIDPFAGSNTTGFVAELLGRKWVSIEADKAYAVQSKIRFEDPGLRRRARKREA